MSTSLPLSESFFRRHKTWLTLGLAALGFGVPYFLPGGARFQAVRGGELERTVAAPFQGNPVSRLFRPPVEPVLPAALLAEDDSFVEDSPVRPPSGPQPGAATRSLSSMASSPSVGKGLTPLSSKALPPLPKGVFVDPRGSMSHFYQSLARTTLGETGAITRICHFGDSPVTGDLISGDARAKLQARFGAAGSGWILAGRPWEWYNHRGVRLDAKGWRVRSALLPPGRAGSYGLGGACFESSDPSSYTRIEQDKGGAPVGRFMIYYRGSEGGGTLLARVDGGTVQEVPTSASHPGPALHILNVVEGRHSLELRPKGDGPVVLYGVALEGNSPGVVYDAVGANGATIRHLLLSSSSDWVESLRLRAPDLVILNFGTNESGYGWFSLDQYRRDYETVIRRVRQALPAASVMIMAPMDRGMRDESGLIVTMPSIPRIVQAQRDVAMNTGCAFFDTFTAMGGEGTMGRWYEWDPRLVTGDLTHPTGVGANVLGKLLARALSTAPQVPPAPPEGAEPILASREVTPPPNRAAASPSLASARKAPGLLGRRSRTGRSFRRQMRHDALPAAGASPLPEGSSGPESPMTTGAPSGNSIQP